MKNNVFEERLGVKMEALRIKPAEAVWQEIEQRIKKERKKRILMWWILSSCMLIAGTGIWVSQEHSAKDAQFAFVNKKESMNPVDRRGKSSSISDEKTILNPSIVTSKTTRPNFDNTLARKNISTRQKANNQKEDIIERFSAPLYHLQERLSDKASKPSTAAESMITDNLNKRINDTIIVVNCNTPPPINASVASPSKNKERQLNFNAFYSFHGSGDLSGGNFEFGTESTFGKRYAFFNNLGISIHSGQEAGFGPRLYPLQLNSTFKSLQTVTAGIQTTPTFYRYSKRGDLKIGVGLMARYQITSSSLYGARSMGLGTNQFSYSIYENDPNTFSIGYRISADLLLFETKKNKLGFQLLFQNDTRGDVITGMGLSFQTKYKN